MSVEKNFIRFEQGLKLKKLGIDQNYSNFYFVHTKNDLIDYKIAYRNAAGQYKDIETGKLYTGTTWRRVSAFTIPELMQMIQRGSKDAEHFYDAMQKKINGGNSSVALFNPTWICDFIIERVEGGVMKALTINERLLSFVNS